MLLLGPFSASSYLYSGTVCHQSLTGCKFYCLVTNIVYRTTCIYLETEWLVATMGYLHGDRFIYIKKLLRAHGRICATYRR